MNTRTTRPQWAKTLTARQWNDLKLCQGTGTPKLTQLLRDIEHQAESMKNGDKMPCWACWMAVQTVRPNHPALKTLDDKRKAEVSA